MTTKLLPLIAIAIALCVIATIAFACPVNPQCPIHDYSTGIFSGQTQFVDGVMLGLYNCPRGHSFWVRCQ